MWRLFRAWAVARITGEIPVVVWINGRVGKVVAGCPLCGESCVGLRHLVQCCDACGDLRVGLADGRMEGILEWALSGTDDLVQLSRRVKLVGFCAARFVYALCGKEGRNEHGR